MLPRLWQWRQQSDSGRGIKGYFHPGRGAI
jgi:hypothetical protein